MLDGRGNGDFFLSLKELLRYMLAYSDNNACDILISFAGGMDYIQAYVKNLGFDNTILRVTEKEMQDNPEKQKINRATPADVSRFLALILREGFFMPAHRSFVQETLIQTNTGEDKIKRFLPPDVVMGHKTGTGMRTADGMRIAVIYFSLAKSRASCKNCSGVISSGRMVGAMPIVRQTESRSGNCFKL